MSFLKTEASGFFLWGRRDIPGGSLGRRDLPPVLLPPETGSRCCGLEPAAQAGPPSRFFLQGWCWTSPAECGTGHWSHGRRRYQTTGSETRG